MAVDDVLDMMSEINEDGSVPRNVKQILNEVKDIFKDTENELKIRVDAAMQKLEDLSSNPNLPSHTRTQIWNMTSVLEDLNQKE